MNPDTAMEPPISETDGKRKLCNLHHETDQCQYQLALEVDISKVSLEGLNCFLITVESRRRDSGLQERLHSDLELNLRQSMSSVSVAGEARQYFTVTGRSLTLEQDHIDSSIHEAVDLGLMGLRIRSGARPTNGNGHNILFDTLTCNLLKGAISTLLAQATICHRQVILNADHIFASRQDYVRDMCNSMARQAGSMATSIIGKAMQCDQGLF